MMNTQDKAGHVNGTNLSVLQETVGAIKKDPGLGICRFRARGKWSGGAHNCTTVTDFDCAKQTMQHKLSFELHCDKPHILAGEDDDANPVEHLLVVSPLVWLPMPRCSVFILRSSNLSLKGTSA